MNIYGPPTPRNLTKAKFTEGSKWELSCPMGGWPLNVETIAWQKDGSAVEAFFSARLNKSPNPNN